MRPSDSNVPKKRRPSRSGLGLGLRDLLDTKQDHYAQEEDSEPEVKRGRFASAPAFSMPLPAQQRELSSEDEAALPTKNALPTKDAMATEAAPLAAPVMLGAPHESQRQASSAPEFPAPVTPEPPASLPRETRMEAMQNTAIPPKDWPLHAERIEVRGDRIVFDLALHPQAPRFTDSRLARIGREAFPGLEGHPCINHKGAMFGDVMESTSLPHLLEHLVIHLQTQRERTDFTFLGTTEWLDERRGTARVEINFTDDLIALCAFRDACEFLRKAVVI